MGKILLYSGFVIVFLVGLSTPKSKGQDRVDTVISNTIDSSSTLPELPFDSLLDQNSVEIDPALGETEDSIDRQDTNSMVPPAIEIVPAAYESAYRDTVPKPPAASKPILVVSGAEPSLYHPIIGLGGGILSYFGDLKPDNASGHLKDNLAFDFSISARTNKYLTLGLYFLKGKFTVDEKSADRNLNFQASLSAGGIYLSHNFTNWIKEESIIHPYFSFGVEAFEFYSKGDLLDANGKTYYYWKDGTVRTEAELGTNPQAAVTTKDFVYESDLREANLDSLNRYSQYSFSLPVGAGVEFRLSKRIKLNLGTSIHFTFTDLLDNISNAGKGIREGQSDLDKFLYSSLSLKYTIGPDEPEEIIEPDTSLIAIAPKDEDKDGVTDDKDLCPDTPDSVEVDSTGCPTKADEDEDGVPNFKDLELNTPFGAQVDTNGVQISISSDSLWTVLLGAYPKGTFPTLEFTNEILSMFDVQSEMINDTTFYIKGLFDNPEDAEISRIDITNSTGLKDAKVVLWKPKYNSNVVINRTIVETNIANSQKQDTTQWVFRVQLGAFSKLISTDFFRIDDVVMIPGKDGLYRYLTGNFYEYENAEKYRQKMKEKGFSDAFVVVYKGGERVTLKDAGIEIDSLQEQINEEGVVVISRPPEEQVAFKIQIYISKDPIYLAPANFKGLENVEEYMDGGLYKYTSGESSDLDYANNVLLNDLRGVGFRDAFVVAFYKNKRITLERAMEILKK